LLAKKEFVAFFCLGQQEKQAKFPFHDMTAVKRGENCFFSSASSFFVFFFNGLLLGETFWIESSLSLSLSPFLSPESAANNLYPKRTKQVLLPGQPEHVPDDGGYQNHTWGSPAIEQVTSLFVVLLRAQSKITH
jgi:hypothetical protein